MTKKELETMLPRLLDELKAQRMHYEKIVRAQKRRLNKQERLLAETEPKPELQDLPENPFAEACEHAPALVVIDEMDAFMPNRATMSNEHAHTKEEVGCFLKAIQRAAEKHVLVVGMTNLIESIDPAILRTGRMGTHIKVDMPSLAEVEDVLAYALDKRPHEDFPLTRYAEQLLNRPLSDVTYAADEAAMHAARARRHRITEADLAAAIRRLEAHTAPKDERRPMGFAA